MNPHILFWIVGHSYIVFQWPRGLSYSWQRCTLISLTRNMTEQQLCLMVTKNLYNQECCISEKSEDTGCWYKIHHIHDPFRVKKTNFCQIWRKNNALSISSVLLCLKVDVIVSMLLAMRTASSWEKALHSALMKKTVVIEKDTSLLVSFSASCSVWRTKCLLCF